MMKCQAELDWVWDQYQRMDIRGQNDMVMTQLAIPLFHFGHFGNSASVESMAQLIDGLGTCGIHRGSLNSTK
jgi:hypothetical protein